MVKHVTMEAIEKVYLSTGAPTSFGIADLGCSSGPNTLSIVKEIIQAFQSLSSDHLRQSSEFRVYLNDLPTNDFNSIFKALPDFCRELQNEGVNQNPSGFFIGAYPGSFYQRLFPSNCLHFVYSNYSLHWLSRVCHHCYFFFFFFFPIFLEVGFWGLKLVRFCRFLRGFEMNSENR